MHVVPIISKFFIVAATFAIACSCSAAPREPHLLAATHLIAPDQEYSLARIDHCGMTSYGDKNGYSLFDGNEAGLDHIGSKSTLSSWNHAGNGSTTEWIGLKQPATTYDLQSHSQPTASCNNAKSLSMVLVKKIADWDHQHVNGIEYHIDGANLSFGDVQALVLDISVDSKNTFIPTPTQLRTIYKNDVPPSVIDKLDAGKVNIGLTLNGEQNLRASIIIEVDQATLSDQRIRVTIPIKAMKFYQEVNYRRTPQAFADLAHVGVKGLLIVAETKSGSVLRHDIANWSESVPETFKEIGISIQKIEFKVQSRQ